jgi:hypothetical protein
MSQGIAVPSDARHALEKQSGWKAGITWTAAILISIVFFVAGLWKLTDPIGAAVRLAQAKVPESLSVFTAVGLGTLETFTGVLLLVPRFRRWGACLGTFLLAAFMVFIAIHYTELRGADCSCFPWVKRAVGPAFFAGDGAMMLLAIAAGVWARTSQGVRPAAVVFGAVAVFALASFGFASTRHIGTKAPAAIAAEDGRSISLAARGRQSFRVFLQSAVPPLPRSGTASCGAELGRHAIHRRSNRKPAVRRLVHGQGRSHG